MLTSKRYTPTASGKKYRIYLILLLSFLLMLPVLFHGQTFSPIPVTGFNQDAIAEAGPNSLVTTTSAVDGGSSNKIIYTMNFRSFAGIAGGGIPDNGTIVNGTSTYQMASYTGNNSLFVKRGETAELTVTTPAAYNRVRILCLSTEGTSLLNVTLFYTDGSSSFNPVSLNDWFNSTTNLVVTGIGRCDRSAGPVYNADGFTTNPRMYYIEIVPTCLLRPKLLQKISFSNVTTAGNNAPFPNAVFFAVSGSVSTQTVTNIITPSNCAGNTGSVAVTVSGGVPPYTYSWNTTPVQTTATATGLAPGNYAVTITDGSGCATTTQPFTVPLNNNAAMTAAATNPVICAGQSTQLSANVTTGNLTSFTWTPGNLTGATQTVTPATTTTYTVTGNNTIGCTATANVTVTVNASPAAPVVPPVQICAGDNPVLQVQNPEAGATYNWYTTASGGTPVFTGNPYAVGSTTTYPSFYVEITNAAGCTSNTRTAATIVLLAPLPSPVVVVDAVSFNSVSFRWDPVPGATGYQVSADGGATYQTPSSGPTGTTHTIGGLLPNQTVTIQVRALMGQACQTSLLSAAVSGTTFASTDIFVPNVFTPNNDGKNDKLYVYSNAIVEMKMVIYNQWGEKIFESAGIADGWDGRHHGVMQPMGVYVYVLKAKMQDNSVITKKGSINIIR